MIIFIIIFYYFYYIYAKWGVNLMPEAHPNRNKLINLYAAYKNMIYNFPSRLILSQKKNWYFIINKLITLKFTKI